MNNLKDMHVLLVESGDLIEPNSESCLPFLTVQSRIMATSICLIIGSGMCAFSFVPFLGSVSSYLMGVIICLGGTGFIQSYKKQFNEKALSLQQRKSRLSIFAGCTGIIFICQLIGFAMIFITLPIFMIQIWAFLYYTGTYLPPLKTYLKSKSSLLFSFTE